MSLRERNFADDCAQYDSRAAQYERILQQLFPGCEWRVACYQRLVAAARIRPNVRPPAWLLIEVSSQDGQVHKTTEVDLHFFACVSDEAGLLAIVGKRLKAELAC